MRKDLLLFIFTMIFSIFYLIAPSIIEAIEDEDINKEYVRETEERIERLKEDMLRFNTDILEKEFFNNSNLVVFLSLEVVHPFHLETVDIRLDESLLQGYRYSKREQEALMHGGSQILYIGEIKEGEHTLSISYRGIEHNKRLVSEDNIRLVKRRGVKYIEITIRDQDKKPHLLIGVMDFTTPSATMEKMLYKLIKYYEDLRDYLNASTILLLSIRRETDINKKGELRILLGKLYIEWRFYSNAINTFKELIKEFPPNRRIYSKSWFYLGKIYYNLTDFDDALFSFSRINQERIDSSLLHERWYLTGNINNNMKAYLSSVDILEGVPEDSEYFPFARYSMGLSYLNIGDSYSAVLNFKKITRFNPKGDKTIENLIERTHITLGYLFIEQNRLEKAMSEFESIPIDSIYFDQVLFGIGWSFMKMGEFVKAIVSFKDLVERYPDSPYKFEAVSIIGYCYARLNSYNKANESYYNALTFYTSKIKEVELAIDNLPGEIKNGLIFRSEDNSKDVEGGLKEWLIDRIQLKKDIFEDIERYEEIISLEEFYKQILTDLLDKRWKRWKIIYIGKDRAKNISLLRERLKEVRSLKEISFKMVEESLIKELNGIKERLEELSVETTIRITTNMVKGNTGLARGLTPKDLPYKDMVRE